MKVIDVDQQKDQAQHRDLRDSRCDWDRVWFLAPINDLLPTVTKEVLYPAQGVGKIMEYLYDVESCKLLFQCSR